MNIFLKFLFNIIFLTNFFNLCFTQFTNQGQNALENSFVYKHKFRDSVGNVPERYEIYNGNDPLRKAIEFCNVRVNGCTKQTVMVIAEEIKNEMEARRFSIGREKIFPMVRFEKQWKVARGEVPGNEHIAARGYDSVEAGNCKGVERVKHTDLTPIDFVNKYVKTQTPVIVEGATSHWPAISKWSIPYLMSKYARAEIQVHASYQGQFDYVERLDSGFWPTVNPHQNLFHMGYNLSKEYTLVHPHRFDSTMGHFLRNLLKPKHKVDQEMYYVEYFPVNLLRDFFEKEFGEIAFLEEISKVKKPTWNLWVAGEPVIANLHIDSYENLNAPIIGTKTFLTFDPEQTISLMTNTPMKSTNLGFSDMRGFVRDPTTLTDINKINVESFSPVNFSDPDAANKWPTIREAKPVRCTIHPGEVFYNPGYWPHEVITGVDEKKKLNVALNFFFPAFYQLYTVKDDSVFYLNPDYAQITDLSDSPGYPTPFVENIFKNGYPPSNDEL